jgi:hypothetical protein
VIDKGTMAIKFQTKINNAGASAIDRMIATAEKAKPSRFLKESKDLPWCLNAREGLWQARQS